MPRIVGKWKYWNLWNQIWRLTITSTYYSKPSSAKYIVLKQTSGINTIKRFLYFSAYAILVDLMWSISIEKVVNDWYPKYDFVILVCVFLLTIGDHTVPVKTMNGSNTTPYMSWICYFYSRTVSLNITSVSINHYQGKKNRLLINLKIWI